MLLAACALFFVVLPAFVMAAEKPQKIVSLNLCTDQLLMMLVAPDRIAAVSYLAQQPESSVMAGFAASLPITYGGGEDVIMLQPDLVLAGTYSTRATVNMLRKLKYNVAVLEPARTLSDIEKNIAIIARLVGEVEKGSQLIKQVREKLSDKPSTKNSDTPTAALVYANSYTSGTGTLANQIVTKGGFKNLGQRLGLSGTARISLESLLVEKPEAIILGRTGFGKKDMAHQVFQHPALKKILAKTKSMILSDTYWVCGTPYTLTAVERVRKFHKSGIFK